jgi:hypothetical protein
MRTLRAITAVLVVLLLLDMWPGLRAGQIEAGASGRGPALPTSLLRALTRAGLGPSATSWTQQAKLTARDAAPNDVFGYSVALSGDGSTAVVGAEGKNNRTGAAYVFVRSGTAWTQQAELTARDATPGATFGLAVALAEDGSTVLVGAAYKNNNTGAAYVFARSGSSWTQQAKLTARDAAQNDLFGGSVALAGDGSTAVVGAWGKNTGSGAAYAFARSGVTWMQQAELIASDAATDDGFGSSVAVAGDGSTALVGTPDKSSGAGNASGAAYVFVRSGSSWTQQQELTASDAAQNDQFGWSVALSGVGSAALVSADGQNSYTGAAYVFVRSGSTWTQQAKLTAGDAAHDDDFGYSVALAGDGSTALVGASGKDIDTGAAYVFVRSGSTWTQQAKLTASDAAQYDEFGGSVALAGDGSTALVGALGKDTETGAAYVYAAGAVSTPTSTATPTASSTPTGTSTSTATSTATATATVRASITRLTQSANPTVFGQTVTFTATVAPLVGSGTPTGTVTFKDGATTLGSRTLAGGSATLTTSILAVSAHSMTAVYSGDSAFGGSTSAALGHTVIRATTTTTLVSSPNPSAVGQAVTFTATVAALAPGAGVITGTVTFKDGTTVLGTVALVSGHATFTTSTLTVATHSIYALYGGSSAFSASTAGLHQTVYSKVTLTSSPNPSLFGQTVALTASVSPAPASGTVSFKDGASVLGSAAVSGGMATLSTSKLAVGVHSLTASFSAGGVSAPRSQTVRQAATTTTMSASPNPSVSGQVVTFTATVGAVAPGSGTPTGTVTFKDGTTVLGTVALVSGHATSALTVGMHSIYALYGGSSAFTASTAGLHQTVNRASSTTSVVGNPNLAPHGANVTFTATVHAVAPGAGVPSGTVTFKDGATVLGTASLNVAGVTSVSTSALTVGTHTITASYGGDTHFHASSGSVAERVS